MHSKINNTEILIAEERRTNYTLALRSEEISEILSNRPSLLVRWGNTIFFMVLVTIVALCWFIKYPDIISTKATMTSINTPKEFKTKIDGRLIKLMAISGNTVNRSDVIGWIECRANHTEVINLSRSIDSLQLVLRTTDKTDAINVLSKQYFDLGEVQPAYQIFIQAYQVFKEYMPNGYNIKKKAMLEKDMTYLQLLNKSLLQQQSMQNEDLQLSNETFRANEELKNDKVISAFDYRTEKSKLIGKRLSLPQIASAIITNEAAQHAKQKEIAELENEVTRQKNIFIEVMNTFKAQLDEWKSKYLLIAPMAGKVFFTTFLQEGQQLQNNQSVFFIDPQNSEYFAVVNIPQTNFGKIKTGQKVLLKLAAYPFQEFGFLEGKLDFISNIPTDSGYLAKVLLPNGLTTSYHKQLQFRDGLTAQSDIITKDVNLLERFFYQTQSILKK